MTSTALVALTAALSIAGLALIPTAARAATTTIDQCNNVGPGPGGATTAMNCTVNVVNTIAGGVASSTTTVTRTCALDPCPTGNGTFTSSSSSLVTNVTQCNGSDNDAAHPITCTVTITNNISADTPSANPLAGVTVDQCVGSANGGGHFGALAPLVCNPYPATTTNADVTQCNGSAVGGGSSAVCSVGSASTVSPAIPVTVNQCNGSGNAGGTLLTCSVSISTDITVAVTPSPTPTVSPTASATPTPSDTATPSVRAPSTPTTSATPQIPRVPSGGVGAGGGSTAPVNHGGLLTVSAGLLFAAAVTTLFGRRASRRR